MSEFGFIESIKQLCEVLPKNDFEGIGDDCAVLPVGKDEALLFTADMLVENVHFLRDPTFPYDLGCKSLAVNLSDIAAMGAKPIATLLSISLPKELTGTWSEDFMRGYCALAEKHGVALVGGDTTSSRRDLSINITAIGRAPMSSIKRRSMAQVGDVIFVTGILGGSGVGLDDILRGEWDTPFARLHMHPIPRVEEGMWLGSQESVHAMMDISDGVASDLRHILNASGVGAEVELTDIPRNSQVPLQKALEAGEDYELLFTVDEDCVEDIMGDFGARFNIPISPIGRIVAGGDLVWLNDGELFGEDFKGFTHY